ncbi:MAG: GspE/PulE family protein [Desulfatiglandaceae bacterium]
MKQSENWDRSFPEKEICQVLVDKGLISEGQKKDILGKKPGIKRRLEAGEKKDPATQKGTPLSDAPVTIVDVIASLKLTRADDQARPLDEEIIVQALAEHWNLPYLKIDPLKLDLNLVTGTIPHSFARKHLVLPTGIQDGTLTVATPNPFNQEVLEDIARACHMKVRVVVSSKTDILKLINEFFGFKRSIAAAEHQFTGLPVDLGNLEQYVKLRSSEDLPSDDHHIINAVNHLLNYAFDQKASDVHLEPKRESSLVRMRIDGVLHTVYKLPKNVHSAMVSRIKNLSRLDMAEKRRPQDGRIKTARKGVEAEIRISTVPVAFGEKVVMRIMDPDVLFQDLQGLGFTEADLEHFKGFIKMPYGIVLVCGPTGSGKSTTLYSALRYLSTPEINITTVEDPIEMVNEDFNQIAVQPVVGVTFSTILRSILRQDPDIIMLGEMRDLETAQNAVQAALTGHLVLSTLHTNDAPSAITRLLDLGVPSFLIQATLVGALSQRLLRKICPYCKESFPMESRELETMGLDLGKRGTVTLQRGKGCIKCRGTGYLGRTALFEVMPFSEPLKQLVTRKKNLEDLKAQARAEGMVSLRENAVNKLLEGMTTYQEVLRVTWNQ